MVVYEVEIKVVEAHALQRFRHCTVALFFCMLVIPTFRGDEDGGARKGEGANGFLSETMSEPPYSNSILC